MNIAKILIKNSDKTKAGEYIFYLARPDKREREISDAAKQISELLEVPFHFTYEIIIKQLRMLGEEDKFKYGTIFYINNLARLAKNITIRLNRS